ncbi:hypothetical protein QO010_001725 [Caulobacter ginsengisoli]|uniref:Uncharacterized protein n=1 Tax=Caulobacter ginsengisoli TaxID=400775 RepID=A0ABU0IPR3_9CAUL|nr:hypothetical protein [Caulobacter ginsengisoli]MDQ0463954.1 hypothetical protein [Caulobacter ginsengisoli]
MRLARGGESLFPSHDAIQVSPLEIALSVDASQPGLDELLALE